MTTQQPEQQPHPQHLYGRATTAERPSRQIGWSIVAIFFLWPLAVVSFVVGAQVGSRWERGDLTGAQRASRNARLWALASIALGIAAFAYLRFGDVSLPTLPG